jgi:hypothetical protein
MKMLYTFILIILLFVLSSCASPEAPGIESCDLTEVNQKLDTIIEKIENSSPKEPYLLIN